MGDVISLKLHRKRLARAGREAEAAQSRLTHGRAREEKALTQALNEKAAKDLDNSKRED